MQLTDNAGATGNCRALNYLATRYPPIYAEAAEEFTRDFSLTGVEVPSSPLSSTRNIVDVIFSYTASYGGGRGHRPPSEPARLTNRIATSLDAPASEAPHIAPAARGPPWEKDFGPAKAPTSASPHPSSNSISG